MNDFIDRNVERIDVRRPSWRVETRRPISPSGQSRARPRLSRLVVADFICLCLSIAGLPGGSHSRRRGASLQRAKETGARRRRGGAACDREAVGCCLAPPASSTTTPSDLLEDCCPGIAPRGPAPVAAAPPRLLPHPTAAGGSSGSDDRRDRCSCACCCRSGPWPCVAWLWPSRRTSRGGRQQPGPPVVPRLEEGTRRISSSNCTVLHSHQQHGVGGGRGACSLAWPKRQEEG